MIQLVGPGGAGKTTAGAALAEQLGVSFLDLDAAFNQRHGDISAYLRAHSYDSYAALNVDVYSTLIGPLRQSGVLALSSGFMTYPDAVHPHYARLRQAIASSESTFVLMPSLDLETCVAETVRRQLVRPFARTAQREEQVIRARFPIYAGLETRKVQTMRPPAAVVAELMRTDAR